MIVGWFASNEGEVLLGWQGCFSFPLPSPSYYEVIDMCKIELNTKTLATFIASFPKTLKDMRIMAAGARIAVEVAYAHYYVRKSEPATVHQEGALHITALDKVTKFLKAAKGDTVVLRQTSPTKPLHIESGSNKLQLPSSDDIESANKAPIVRNIVEACANSGYSSFGEYELSAHATLMTTDLIALGGMKSLIAKDSQYKARIHCGEGEFGIVAGKASSGRIFSSIEVIDSDGPSATVQSHFGEWLPECLAYLDDEGTRLHMGDNAPLVFEQNHTTLVIVQEADA